MGGTLPVTIRTADGTEYRMYRWTNSLPSFLQSVRFYEKDPKHPDGYMKSWFDMQADWLKHKKDKAFEFNMTDCYAPYPAYLAPDAYGLVVIDYQSSTVLSNQGYCSLDTMGSSAIALSMEMKEIGEGKYQFSIDADGEAKDFIDLWDAKWIKRITEYVKDAGGYSVRDVSDLANGPYNNLLIRIGSIRDGERTFRGKFEFDSSPWVMRTFEESSRQAWKDMRQAVLDLGFVLSKKEQNMWDERIKECEDTYGEEP